MAQGSIIVESVSFQSEGYTLQGRLYRPAGEGPFPGVVLCHGFPGDEKNMDLAEELAFNDIVVLVFFYRGAWGSEGDYNMRWLAPSARDATDFLESHPHVAPERMGMIAHSMGAITLILRLRDDPRLKAGAYMAPADDLRGSISEERLEFTVGIFLGLAAGKLTGFDREAAVSGLRWAVEEGNPISLIGDVHVPVKVIVGSKDALTTVERCKSFYDTANEPKAWALIEGADHVFTEHRYPLMDEVLGWLKEHL